jgi:hypothetical protein
MNTGGPMVYEYALSSQHEKVAWSSTLGVIGCELCPMMPRGEGWELRSTSVAERKVYPDEFHADVVVHCVWRRPVGP